MKSTARTAVSILILFVALFAAACSRSNGLVPAAQSADAPPSPATLQGFLNSEFQRLGIDPDKVAAAAPSGAANAVFDLYAVVMDGDDTGPLPPDAVYLSWTELLNGDCDQNGEVNSADLTPIGLKFNGTVDYDDPGQHGGLAVWPSGVRWDGGGGNASGSADPGSPADNWRKARIDTDNNGEINISDITALAVHWQERTDGYVVYRKLAGEAEFSPLPNPSIPSADYTVGRETSPEPTRPVVYEFTDENLGGSTGIAEYYVAPYDTATGTEGTPSPVLQVDLGSGNGGTFDPVAELYPDPAQGDIPFNMTWHADNSYDLDGSIVKFEWDMDGDNSTWEYDSGTDPTLQITYNTTGEKEQWVRVTDNAGHTAMTSATCTVTDSGQNIPPVPSFTASPDTGDAPLTVFFDGSASNDPDGVIIDYQWDPEGDDSWPLDTGSSPTAQYTYNQPGSYTAQLLVTDDSSTLVSTTVQVTVTDASPQWHIEDPSGTSNTVGDISLAIIDGNPAVAWSDTSTQIIHYMRATDSVGHNWGPVRSVAGYTFNQSTVDVALIDLGGNPGIAFFNPANAYTGTLYFIHASDADGSSFGVLNTVATGVDVLLGLDGVMVDGAPALAYRDVQNNNFDYCRSGDPSGVSWPAPVHIDSNPVTPGYHCDLEVIFGRPAAIAGNEYYRAADATGSAWSGADTIDMAVGTGWIASLAVADNNPAICFYDNSPGDENLHYVRALDGPGGVWGTPELVDPGDAESGDDQGNNCVMGLFENVPYIVYENSTQGGLFASWAVDAKGTSFEEPQPISAGFIRATSTAASTQAPLVAWTESFGFKVAGFYHSVGVL